MRQVSKTWDRAAIPYLFDEIFISQDMVDFRIAKLVILQFKQYIRTLVYSSVYYPDIDAEIFCDGFEMDHGDTCTDFDHPAYAFSLYRLARKNQKENFKNGSSPSYLSIALATLPSVRKIVLTDRGSSRIMSEKSLQAFRQRRLTACPLKFCNLEATAHVPHSVMQSGFHRTGYSNPWRVILSALSNSNANIKELTMEPCDMELGTNTSAFATSPGNLSQIRLCFRSLTKIRLSLLEDTEKFSTSTEVRHVHKNVAKLLRSAINLEYLSLDLYDSVKEDRVINPTLTEILGRCNFPKLRSLNLGFFACSEVELVGFLKHSRYLEHLTITDHDMTEGLWARVADWMRASLRLLKSAEMIQLYSGFEEPWEDFEYMDLYGDVEKFFFAGGENPFTKKSLEEYERDLMGSQPVTKHFRGRGYHEACARYH